MPSDIPDVKNMADVIRLRSSLFNILGARSFLLRCSQAEARLQDGRTKKFYNDKWREEEEEFITSGNWRGKHNSLSRGAGADQP